MPINRRDLLKTAVAAAAVAAMPASLLAAEPVAPAAVEAAPLAEARHGWWGYSTNGGEWFNGPFDSREQALAEARSDYPESETITAWCIPYQLRVPDLREHCIEWIAGFDRRLDVSDLIWVFEGANSDYDYEGEVGDELSRADYKPLIADLRDATATALFRAGRPDLIAAVYDDEEERDSAICEDEALLDVLGRDRQFRVDCEEAGERWIVATGVKDAPRMLSTEDDQEHRATATEADA